MELNRELHSYITPVVVFFIVCNTVGLLGNVVVIYIYALRYPRSCFQCLVLALSLVDFMSCCTTVPMETVSSWYWFAAPSRLLCKAKNFCVQLSAQCAICLLFVIAVYKYRRICKPLGKQISLNTVFIMCCVGILTSVAFAVPAAVFWDINNGTVQMHNSTEDTFICEVHSEFIDTPYPKMYRHVLSAYVLFLLATIIIYIFIARSVILHSRMMRNIRKQTVAFTNSSLSTDTSIGSGKFAYSRDRECHVIGLSYRLSYTQNNQQESAVQSNTSSKRADISVKSGFQNTQITPILIRKVLIMAIISGTFSVTFIMGLVFGYLFATRNNDDYSSFSELVIMFACYRFYFINYALNPVVYFNLDLEFRRKVFKLFSCCYRA